MNIEFRPKSAIIYDFLRVVVTKYNNLPLLGPQKKMNLTFSDRARESYDYVCADLDFNVPGVPVFFSNIDSRGICYMYKVFDHRLHEFTSLEQMLAEIFDRDTIELQLDVLRFYGYSVESDTYYSELLQNPNSLVSFINSLSLSDSLNWDLTQLMFNPDIVLASLMKFCKKASSRLTHVYKKYSEDIREFNSHMRSKIKLHPTDFMENEIGVLLKTLPVFDVEEYVVIYSFINEILVSSYREGLVRIFVLGIRYEEQLEKVKDIRNIQSFEIFFKAFSDKNRLAIINLLVSGELCVGDIASALKLAFTTTSYHLEALYSAGLLSRGSIGKKMFYRINKEYSTNQLTQIKKIFETMGV